MKVPIIKIGNSKGIRLPKTILAKYEMTDSIEMVMEDEVLILKPIKEARSGWNEAFQQMNEDNDDQLLIDDVFEDEDLES